MRTLKVEDHWRDASRRRLGTNRAGSILRLKGRWLEAAGFPPGTKVEVIASAPGQLVIRRREGGEA